MKSVLLTFAGPVLLAGDRDNTSTGPGRVFILHVLETTPEFGISLLGLLAQPGWSRWMSVAQPSLLRTTSKLLVQALKWTLRLLARLVHMDRSGRGGVDITWRWVVSGWVFEQLMRWQFKQQGSEEYVETVAVMEELHGLLALLAYVERLYALLIDIVERILPQDGSPERSKSGD